MSVWDDSWGATRRRPWSAPRSTEEIARIGAQVKTADRALATPHRPDRTPSDQSGRSGLMPTIVPHEDDGNRRVPIVTDTDPCPACGWQRWEHERQPGHCGWFGGDR